MSSESLELPIIGTGLGSSSLITGQMIYVMNNGDNTTAQPYDLLKPYETVLAAVNAAVAGDTVVVYSGTYTTNANIAKDGVRWHLHTGALIEYVGTDYLFDTTEFTNDTIITGNGSFYSEFGGIVKHVVNSILFEFYECIGMSTTAVMDLSCNGYQRSIKVKGKYRAVNINTTIGDSAVITVFSDDDQPLNAYISIPRILASANNSIRIDAYALSDSVIVDCLTATQYIEANVGTWNISGSEGSNFRVIGAYGNNLQICGKLETLNVYIGCFISFNGYSTNTIISGTRARVYGGTHGTLTLSDGEITNALISGATIDPVVNISGGSASLKIDSMLDYVQTGGLCTLYGNMSSNTAETVVSINISAGKLILQGSFCQNDCSRMIDMTGECTVDLSDANIYMNGTAYSLAQAVVIYNGGLLMSNGAKLVMYNTTKSPILCYGTVRDYYVLSRGLNTNYTETSLSPAGSNRIYIEVQELADISLTIDAYVPGLTVEIPYNISAMGAANLQDVTSALEQALVQARDEAVLPFTVTHINDSSFYLTTTQADSTLAVHGTPTNLVYANVHDKVFDMNNALDGTVIQHSSAI